MISYKVLLLAYSLAYCISCTAVNIFFLTGDVFLSLFYLTTTYMVCMHMRTQSFFWEPLLQYLMHPFEVKKWLAVIFYVFCGSEFSSLFYSFNQSFFPS